MRYRVAVIAVALLVTGCGTPGAGMLGEVFHSTSVTEQGQPRPLVEGTRVELRFTEDGQLFVSAGCEEMHGRVETGDFKLEVSDRNTTALGCTRPALRTQDKWLFGLLSESPSWRFEGESLVITGSNAEIVLAQEKPVPLEGGKWTVDGLISNDVVSPVPGGVVATLVFGSEQVEVSAGCNSGSAQYRHLAGWRMRFDRLVLTEKACGPDEMTVEKVVTDLLDGQVTAKRERNTMTLTNSSGAGLRLMKQA